VDAAVATLYELALPALSNAASFERGVRRLAASGRSAEVRRAFGLAAREARASLAGGVVRAAPLGYRVEHFDGRVASVAIWVVTLAAGRRLEPRSTWRRMTVDLVWESDRWKVTGGVGGPGPSPSSAARALLAEAASYRTLSLAP
jgi:hypothetical protein